MICGPACKQTAPWAAVCCEITAGEAPHTLGCLQGRLLYYRYTSKPPNDLSSVEDCSHRDTLIQGSLIIAGVYFYLPLTRH